MAVEPGGLKDQLVTAAADGELKFIDFRVLGEGNTAGSSGESAFAMRPPSNSGSGNSGKSPSLSLQPGLTLQRNLASSEVRYLSAQSGSVRLCRG